MQINNSFQKNANMSLVAQQVWRNPGISRIDIARNLGGYRSTVSNIINAFVDKGVMLERKENQPSSVSGRKPLSLEFNPDFGCVIGVDLQPSGYTAVITDFAGIVRTSRSGPLPAGPFEDMPERIIGEIREDVYAVGIPPLALCFGLPGIIDTVNGQIIRSDIFNIHAFPFIRKAEALCNIPVYIENEANCIAWYELLKRREQEFNSLLCMNTEYTMDASRFSPYSGLAVGLGIALDGRVYGGSTYAAGEFFSTFWTGEVAGQNSYSMLDTGRYPSESERAGWVKDVFHSLIPAISIFNPHALIVHGEFAHRCDTVRRILKQEVPVFEKLLKRTGCSLLFSTAEDRVVATGAAHMFLMKLFSMSSVGEDAMCWDAVLDCVQRVQN